MKSKLLAVVALMASFSGAVQADGITGEEYHHMQALSQCVYIANTMRPGSFSVDRAIALSNQAIAVFVTDTAAMRGGLYNPSPYDLASDYAFFYQSAASDIEGEMMQSMSAQGLQLAPESWFTVGAQFWVSRNCAAVERAK